MHYEDDGEWGAGKKLLDLLKTKNIVNQLVVVTQWYCGTHLGPSRFDHIKRAVNDDLELNARNQ